MLTWLNKPYPLIEKTSQKLILAISFAVFVYAFLLIYQPFGASEVKENKALYLSGFAGCVFIGLIFTYMLLPSILPRVFNSEKWTVGREVLYVILSFLVIATLNYFYNTFVGKEIAQPQSFVKFIGITISIGFFPLLALIFLTERYLKAKYQEEAKDITSQIIKPTIIHDLNDKITLQSNTIKSDVMTLNINDFLFAKSEDNYSIIHFLVDKTMQKRLLRVQLKSIENQLGNYDQIIRCHRSFVVNKDHIISAKGNARSLYVDLQYSDLRIPVSRTFPREKLI